ncbi:MAG TPA: ABC transporter permease [Candidatus Saccharimonadales bacterium]|nr:ABC transporter permease [Candidatus Saccharimonadales bacterium]
MTLLAGVVLAAGFGGSALTYTVMLARLAPRSSGLRSMAYATVAEEIGGGSSQSIPWKNFEHLRETAGWSDPVMIAYADSIRAHLSYQQNEREISVAGASNGFFATFTQGLAAGQDFSSAWQGEHGGTEVIVSSALAERLFTGPGGALDRNIVLNNRAFRVVGVAPKSFSGLWSPTDAWVTPDQIPSLVFGAFQREARRAGEQYSPIRDNPAAWQKLPFFYVLAGSAKLSLDGLQRKLERLVRSPDNLPDHLNVSAGLTKDPVWDRKIRSWARLAFLLSTALILAAALNYCGLLLAQAPRYAQEVRLKRVLGAGVLRIVLESMCGPAITVLAGFLMAAFGVIAGFWAMGKQGTRFLPPGGVSWQTALSILGMGLAIACVLAILIALVPSLRLLRDSGAPRMGYTSTASRKANLALHGIVSGQIASCILTCLIAVMIINAVRAVSRETLGFSGDQLTAVEVGPASKDVQIEFSTAGTGNFPLATFTRLAVEGSRDGMSGVKYMSAASCAPLAQPMKTIGIQPMDRDSPPRSIQFCGVSQGFFQAMGNPILAGRSFSDASFTGEVSEVVINRQLASELWPGEEALHRTVRVEVPAWDLRFSGLTRTPDATVFLPLRGNVFTVSFPLYFLARGTESSHSLEGFIRQQAASSMPSLGVSTSYRVDERLRGDFMEQQMRVWLSAGGAALIAIIAYLGLYGVLVHSVNSKRKEMALRACFGASAGSLRKIVIRQALQCSAFAVAISLLAWKPIMTLAASAWLGTVRLSWQSAVNVSLICVATAAIISLFPASMAAKASPAELLREQ